MLVAFGWCQIPDRYWYARFEKSCKELLFELDDLIKVKAEENTEISIDWQFVCLGMEELLMSSPESLNRQRVLRSLGETKTLFLQELEVDDGGCSEQTKGDIEN